VRVDADSEPEIMLIAIATIVAAAGFLKLLAVLGTTTVGGSTEDAVVYSRV
jgi:hypothetical protein